MKKYLVIIWLGFCILLTLKAPVASASPNLAYFCNHPAFYEQHSELQYQSSIRILNSFSKKFNFKSHIRILDIGCGTGLITAYLAEKIAPNSEVIGIDLSPNIIRFAQKKYQGNLHLKFLPMAAEQMNFERPFDVIVSFFCMHWIKNQDIVLKKIKHSLASNGQVLLFFPLRTPALYTAITETMHQPQWQPYFTGYQAPRIFITAKLYKKWLLEADLVPEKVEEIIITHNFQNRKLLTASIKAWLPHLEKLPCQKIDLFLDELINRYIQLTPENNGSTLWLNMVVVIASHSR